MDRPGSDRPPRVRDAVDGDLEAVARIYGHHVVHGLGSFEETPPSPAELARRRSDVLARGLPYLVAEVEGRVAGFAYVAPYRSRSAYRYTLEDSVYVAPDAGRRGLGRALLGELIARAAALGYRQMVAVIGGSDNDASIGLHRAMGFERAGLLRAIGFKHGRWIDSVLMQRALGPGAAEAPQTKKGP